MRKAGIGLAVALPLALSAPGAEVLLGDGWLFSRDRVKWTPVAALSFNLSTFQLFNP